MSHLSEESDYEIRRVLRPQKSKRHRIDIFLDVLRVINEGYERGTHVMYRTNLSWNPLMEIIDILLDQKMITVIKQGSTKFYHITEKGKETLKYFNSARKITEDWMRADLS